MKTIKMLRNREVAGTTYRGEIQYDLEDGVADQLLKDGHATLIEAFPEPEPEPKSNESTSKRKNSSAKSGSKRKKK